MRHASEEHHLTQKCHANENRFLILKMRGRRRQRKRQLKSEFAFFQSSSQLFHITYFFICTGTLLELNA